MLLTHPRFNSGLRAMGHRKIRIVVTLSVSGSVLTRSMRPDHLRGTGQLITRLMSGVRGSGINVVIFTNSTFARLPVADSCVSTGVFLRSVSPSLVSGRNATVKTTVGLTTQDFAPRRKIKHAIVIVASNRGRRNNTMRTTGTTTRGNVRIGMLKMNVPRNTPVPVRNAGSCHHSHRNGMVIAHLGRRVYRRVTRTKGNVCIHMSGAGNTRGTVDRRVGGVTGTSIRARICARFGRRFRTIT